MKTFLVLLFSVGGLLAQTANMENNSNNAALYYCAPAGASGTTYTCSLTANPAAYVTGSQLYRFKADVANTGAATINFNSLGAKTIKKMAGSITTDLVAGDLLAGQIVGLLYDGTNMQMLSQLGTFPIYTTTNTSPVTSATNSTAEQNLMAVTIPAGYLNQAGKTLHIWTQAAYTSGAGSSNGTDTWKAKLCSVSGCASGTVITLVNITSGAVAISVTSGKSEFECWSSTVSTGATGTMEPHGKLGIVLVSTATTPPTWYFDNGTAVTSTFDLTASWFLQITVTKSLNGTSTASNTTTERLLFAEVR